MIFSFAVGIEAQQAGLLEFGCYCMTRVLPPAYRKGSQQTANHSFTAGGNRALRAPLGICNAKLNTMVLSRIGATAMIVRHRHCLLAAERERGVTPLLPHKSQHASR